MISEKTVNATSLKSLEMSGNSNFTRKIIEISKFFEKSGNFFFVFKFLLFFIRIIFKNGACDCITSKITFQLWFCYVSYLFYFFSRQLLNFSREIRYFNLPKQCQPYKHQYLSYSSKWHGKGNHAIFDFIICGYSLQLTKKS